MKEVKQLLKPLSNYMQTLSESLTNTLQYVSTLDRYYTNKEILEKCDIKSLLKSKSAETQLEGLKFLLAVK